MFELSSGHFDRLVPLFDPHGYNSPMLFSVLDGHNPRRAFVDRLDRPTHALVHTRYGMAFATEACSDADFATILAELLSDNALYLVWPSDRPVPSAALALGACLIDRIEFRDCDPTACRRAPLPADMALVPLDDELVIRCLWHGEVLRALGSTANLAPGLGVCLLHDSTIAVEAYALFWGAGQVEVGVVTHPDYRKRGLGAVACAHLLEQCEAQGAQTVWSCHASNLASAALARRLGFRTERRYRLLALVRGSSSPQMIKRQ